jgi:hypothetical protein
MASLMCAAVSAWATRFLSSRYASSKTPIRLKESVDALRCRKAFPEDLHFLRIWSTFLAILEAA